MGDGRRLQNPLALAVLALLFERPMHPYEMAATLRQRHKEDSIKLNYGSLYTAIRLLVREGYIVPHETGRAGRRPERTIYALTEPGRAELHDWMRELVSVPIKEYLRFEAALSLLLILPPDESVALLTARAGRLAEEIARERAGRDALMARGLARVVLIEAEYRLALLEAERQWVTALVAAVQDGSLGGVDIWRAWHDGRAPLGQAIAGLTGEEAR